MNAPTLSAVNLASDSFKARSGLVTQKCQLGKANMLTAILGFVLIVSPQAIASEPVIDADAYQSVKSKRKPADTWKEYPTLTIDSLPDFDTNRRDIPINRFGGRTDMQAEATGFFYPKKIDDRWWLIDPTGGHFIHQAVVSVTMKQTPTGRKAFEERYGNLDSWAIETTKLLRQYGFNGTGNWTDVESIKKLNQPLVYTCGWNFMSGFGGSKKMTYQKSGHKGYPDDCIPVFHPEFETYCEEYAKRLAVYKDDPNLLGHFSDNELPLRLDTLDKHLGLDSSEPDLKYGYDAAWQWLRKRKGQAAKTADITDVDRDAFRGHVVDRYLRLTTSAMRRYDPNHLMLGPRFHGSELKSEAIFGAAGDYLDVIAVNYYNVWTPNAETLASWERWSGRPVIITEWYTKGADSGYANNSGAGWIVPTQADRGRFYQNYTLALMHSSVCVGWHWFKYMDNDPADLSTDPSNRDSNKGIVTIRFEPYQPLLDRMKQINENVYELIDYFDKR